MTYGRRTYCGSHMQNKSLLVALETDFFFVIELFPLLVSCTSPALVLLLFHCSGTVEHCSYKQKNESHSAGGLHGVEFKVCFMQNLQ